MSGRHGEGVTKLFSSKLYWLSVIEKTS